MSNQKLVRLSQVEATSQEWLWPGRIPLRAITNLSGDPGGGKSKITYDLTWRVTTGQPMPGAPTGIVR